MNRKAYWAILKSFTNWKKIPIILPLHIYDQIVTNFNEKANNFNKYFSNQCSVIDNSSKLPTDQTPYTASLLSSIDIKDSDILNILKSLDASKAHGHDDISIRMLKLSQKSILKPLKLIFENCLRTRLFPDQWKKANLVPIHEKGDMQLIENYRPVSLFLICDKIFERHIFNSLFNYLIENNQVLFLVIRLSNKLYLSLTRYIMLLVVTLLLKYEVCFWVFPKRLIRYGMMG